MNSQPKLSPRVTRDSRSQCYANAFYKVSLGCMSISTFINFCRISLPEKFWPTGAFQFPVKPYTNIDGWIHFLVKIQKQPTGKHQCRSGISIKLQSNFIKITLWHGCSLVNLLHLLRTPFPENNTGGLLLKILRWNASMKCFHKMLQT